VKKTTEVQSTLDHFINRNNDRVKDKEIIEYLFPFGTDTIMVKLAA